jgi:excisionase family DNA binding protein
MREAPVIQVQDEPLWTIQQLADYLQVPVRTLRHWRLNGGGPPAIPVGKHLRWRRDGVMRWLDQQAVVAQDGS